MTTYYDGPDLQATVLAALRSAGRDIEAIDSDDVAGDANRMTSGLPGVGLDLLMADYVERMAGLARNVEDGRVGVILAVLSATDDLNRGTP